MNCQQARQTCRTYYAPACVPVQYTQTCPDYSYYQNNCGSNYYPTQVDCGSIQVSSRKSKCSSSRKSSRSSSPKSCRSSSPKSSCSSSRSRSSGRVDSGSGQVSTSSSSSSRSSGQVDSGSGRVDSAKGKVDSASSRVDSTKGQVYSASGRVSSASGLGAIKIYPASESGRVGSDIRISTASYGRRVGSDVRISTASYSRGFGSVSGGAGGRGVRISTASYSHGLGSGGGFYNYQPGNYASTAMTIGNEKIAMQHLNDRLAAYLEKVKTLEKANHTLEINIREVIEKRGPLEGSDFSKHFETIAGLRAQIARRINDNAKLAINLDNVRVAADDFKLKMEYETSMRMAVEADVTRLRKLLDDTNVFRMHLESEIETLKVELITLKKSHKKELSELRAHITQVGVHVDVDAAKGLDLSKIMEEMRAKYEKIIVKNKEELEAWSVTQITEVKVKMTETSTALKMAMTEVTETRRRYQGMEIELQAALSLIASLEAAVHDVDARYNMEVEKYNVIILRLQEELTQIRSNIQLNTTEYEILLDIKVKLQAEIAEYRRLLEGEIIVEEPATKTVQTKVVTITQTLVDGKLVSESKDVQASEKVEPM
ncbi:keratin, type I cytoskeletal 18-like [Cololabis saira]|uniref:keratin, type I cytoskeletal 18-like n=1 Tax=Cololabis saira TaxID=129043 RepID=UPI002AD555FF|nr:keratin, type I cytoskeletal 18-like [Cololabis saira]